MNIEIRSLAEADHEQANDLLKLAFQSSTNRLNDLRLYCRLQPDGWFAAWLDGSLIGTVGAVCYDTIAHVGFMTVHPNLQGQGIGRMLMEHALGWLEHKNVPLIALDASKKGFPLYQKLGFSDIDETATFERQIKPGKAALPAGIQLVTLSDLDELVKLDKPIFGANRRKVFQALLELYPARAFLTRGADGNISGYLFAQLNRIGPWVMLEPIGSEALLQSALTLTYENPVTVCVPSVNQGAVDLLITNGFDRLRAGRHMSKGDSLIQGERTKIFAQTSMGAG